MSEAAGAALKHTPLFESHLELGARLGEANGWEMPQFYHDAKAEYSLVRNAVGLIDLSSYGVIKVGGKECVQFLNGLVTNDVKTLEKGKGMHAAFLSGHGKVRGLCRVLALGEDQFLIINDPQTSEKIFKYVFPFSYAGDFKVWNVAEQHQVVSVQGPRAPHVMKEVCFEPVPDLPEHGWIETLIGGHRAIVVRASHTGETGYDILVETVGLRDVWEFLLMKGSFHGIRPVGHQALDMLRIESGIPVYGVDVDETNMMLEVGMADAVSFTKGCYTGQEAVAMATYRGHVSKKLSGMVIASDVAPSPSDPIIKDGKEIGHVTSALVSPILGATIAMGYVKYGFFDPGNSVEISSRGGPVSASVVELPFYRPPE